jgi:hypothetical protein
MSNIVLKNTLVPLKDPNNSNQNYQFTDSFTISSDNLTSSKLQAALTACDNLDTCGGVQISQNVTSPPPNTGASTIKYVYTLIQLPKVYSPSSCGLQYLPNSRFNPLIGADEPKDRYAMIVNQSDCNAQPFIPQNSTITPVTVKATTTDTAKPVPDYFNTPPAKTPDSIWDNPLIYVGIAFLAMMIIVGLGMVLSNGNKRR